jgi:hypothetical protein
LKISKFENKRQNTVWVTSFVFLWHHRCVTHFIGKAIISFYKSEPKQILQCLGACQTHRKNDAVVGANNQTKSFTPRLDAFQT